MSFHRTLAVALLLLGAAAYALPGHATDGEVRNVDLSSAMQPGSNTVQFEAHGPKGTWINVMLWDGVGE
jgi:hypothetical protein